MLTLWKFRSLFTGWASGLVVVSMLVACGPSDKEVSANAPSVHSAGDPIAVPTVAPKPAPTPVSVNELKSWVTQADDYFNGTNGASKNLLQAAAWYRKAADAGDRHAMSSLGHMYEEGTGGLAKDDAEAVKWYQESSRAGDTQGMRYLGYMYETGLGGLTQDSDEGANWYRKAADAGDSYAMYLVGSLYLHGPARRGADRNEAIRLFRKAAKLGEKLAERELDQLGASSDQATEVSPPNRARATLPSAYNHIPLALIRPVQVFPARPILHHLVDRAHAAAVYHREAEGGDSQSMALLGCEFQFGEGGVAQDDFQAVKWYQKSAEAGNDLGMARLGLMYANGRGGLATDTRKAMELYRKAAEIGSGLAMYFIGDAYENGFGVGVDLHQAVVWYRKSSKEMCFFGSDALKRLGKSEDSP